MLILINEYFCLMMVLLYTYFLHNIMKYVIIGFELLVLFENYKNYYINIIFFINNFK